MTTRDSAWAAGTPCWADLGAADIDKARAFYEALFGWRTEAGGPEFGGYTTCTKDGRTVAGIAQKQDEAPPTWTTYLATEDAEATVDRITAGGGSVLFAPMAVADLGIMCIAVDPAGAVFGLWQAGSHNGFGLANEPGSVCWNENMSRDFEGNKTFYRTLFGYEYGDMSSGADFRYATLRIDGSEVGGIGELGSWAPANTPPHWTIYFAVADTDAAVAKVTELGGAVLRPAEDTPHGRIAVVNDDQGAVFRLISVPS